MYRVVQLKWLRFNNVEQEPEYVAELADMHHKELCLYESKDWSKFKTREVVNIAARNNWLDLLQWCIENKKPRNEEACRIAADFGNLESLKLLRANDCAWNEKTVSCAAYSGFLEIVIWARANGCPWNSYAWKYAKDKHPHIVKWLDENNCPHESWET
jgi:hypothetical protein